MELRFDKMHGLGNDFAVFEDWDAHVDLSPSQVAFLCNRRFGIGNTLEEGMPANLSVWDLERSYKVDPEQFLTMGRSTPFEGVRLWGACCMTFCDGNLVWEEQA